MWSLNTAPFLAIFSNDKLGSDENYDGGLLFSWAIHQVKNHLSTLEEMLPKISDGGSLSNISDNIMDIASDGCFSLGMVAWFEPVLHEKGAWMYPRLFWETGVIGQVLYLEAHAVGISATGIGCYFDDSGKLYLY